MEVKTKKTIKRLEYFAEKYSNPLVAFSGGKDSVVLYDLAKKANIKATFRYNNTTIDPPGTLSFIRQNFPDVIISNPPKSFYKLVEEKGLPSRFHRWCCEKLKESNSKEFDIVIIGVRREESAKRSQRKIIEKYRNELHFNPIIDWTEKEIWQYINDNNLPVIKYYLAPYNFKRHGCVMCPLASSKQQIREAKLFPGHLKVLLKAVKKFRDTHQHLEFVQQYKDEYEMVYLWLHQKLNKTGLEMIENNVFEFNSQKIIENIIH